MPLSYNSNTPQASQTVASTQAPILTNFQSVDSAFNNPTGGVTGGGNFSSYSLQNTTTNFTAKPTNPVAVLHTVASTNGNPELAWINNVNSVGAGPYTGTRLTGGGITTAVWAQFFTTAGVTTLSESYNVSSVVRNSAGNYTINFTRNFASTTYCVNITASNTSSSTFRFQFITRGAGSLNFTTNVAGVATDVTDLNVVIFGTLV